MKKLFHWAFPLLMLLASVAAQASWNADWPHRVKLTLKTGADGVPISGAVDNAVVLVRLHTGNFPFIDAKNDGTDLRFVAADDKTPLKFHIEKFDGLNELALVWVQVPKLSPGSKAEKSDKGDKGDFIWLYYGNPKAVAAADSKTTYDPAQGLVYHFAAGESTPQDSTANNNHATRMTAVASAAGLTAGGATFDGKSELAVTITPSLRAGPNGQTVSMWVKPSDAGDATLMRQTEGGSALVLLVRGGKLVAQGPGISTPPSGAWTAGTWQHVAVVVKDGLTLYLNGIEIAKIAGKAPALGGVAVFGNGLKGELDELQISSTARSADWIKLVAGGQGPDQKFIGTGTAEGGDKSEAGASYLSILLSAVTVDGWVVIAVLGVMFVVSFWVMISKAFLVRKLSKDNEAFMSHFGKLMDTIQPGQALAEREKAEAERATEFGTSPLYRLYAAAVHELHSRFDAYKSAGRQLLINENSLSAIKATVDARLVRELQGLNSKLVVLTVSIAGGPFLGLLGTVVGVMITFAAIAAAGDVNVNAIAPGIAAALVATVAGLAVAIPCLFGYNFLTSRIGEITADLQAFVDELVTRIAENHSS
jgi:biopolymer transport protein ExbB